MAIPEVPRTRPCASARAAMPADVSRRPRRAFVALDQDVAALEEDCRRAAIVITRLYAIPGCGAASSSTNRSSTSGRDVSESDAGRDPAQRRPRATDTIPWTTRPKPAGEPDRSAPVSPTKISRTTSLVATNQADQLALDLDPVRTEHARLEGGVMRSTLRRLPLALASRSCPPNGPASGYRACRRMARAGIAPAKASASRSRLVLSRPAPEEGARAT